MTDGVKDAGLASLCGLGTALDGFKGQLLVLQQVKLKMHLKQPMLEYQLMVLQHSFLLHKLMMLSC